MKIPPCRRLVPGVVPGLAVLAFLFLTLLSAFAGAGDLQGWSVDSDPRKRAFLKYVPADDGPRLLVIGCLRDVDSFVVLSEHDSDAVPADLPVTLTLVNGTAKYSVQGKSDANGISVGERGFVGEFDADAEKRAR